MVKLEEIKRDDHLRGLEGDASARIVVTEWAGKDVLKVFYEGLDGKAGSQLLSRPDEERLQRVQPDHLPWTFTAPGADFKLGLEAYRIQLAHLFDPMMALHTSSVDPLPHQISAVYESMLTRQPLRFVLADDPGAGKTIMAGLLICELLLRADAQRILIVSPGALTEQWQDELRDKFALHFEIFSRDKQERCASGNYFKEQDQMIARLDQLARSEDYQEKLQHTRWDLIVVDEAHKMSAHYYGRAITETGRFKLGKLLGDTTRHYLLMTATPHNGKEEDFQLFLSLLDRDRFRGRFREGAHKVDVQDIMHRVVKEDLLRFDGTRLFPARHATSLHYSLSEPERALYEAVTEYVRTGMNQADTLQGKKKKNNIGFALTQLQRRLASSPEAIHQSLHRRHKRLQGHLEETLRYGDGVAEPRAPYDLKDVPDDPEDACEEMPAAEYEPWVDVLIDGATAARNAAELREEIDTLENLVAQAKDVLRSGEDKKWDELSSSLHKIWSSGKEKLIIFTEHRATLSYLQGRIEDLVGQPGAVVVLHGGVQREARRTTQEEFRNNPEVWLMVATDAAGEGVNLHSAHLMINYDLPWNPNRIEQRFGRIHRIGQREVCQLWNMVARETREGAVFDRLLQKLEVEREALGDQVFDILGEALEGQPLKDLLVEAIRHGQDPQVKAHMDEVIDKALDTEKLRAIIEDKALLDQQMGMEKIYEIKDKMDQAEARKLQPYFVRAFFKEAFGKLGGTLSEREAGRFEIRHVPAKIREHAKALGTNRKPVAEQYERICFEKRHMHPSGRPAAELFHPGHPLMRACTDVILRDHRGLLKQGTILVDPSDDGTEPKALMMIEHSLRQGTGVETGAGNGDQGIISRRLQFVVFDEANQPSPAGWAPHLDLQAIEDQDRPLVDDLLTVPWLRDLEHRAVRYAAQDLAPKHHKEVQERRRRQADKIEKAVLDRLTKEIDYQAECYEKLAQEVAAGKQPAMQAERPKREGQELKARLEQRVKELAAMRLVISDTPNLIGSALIIPQGLLAQRKGEDVFRGDAETRAHIEKVAMEAVMATERGLGHEVKDVSGEKCGWDITARPPPRPDGSLPPDRHIEVKGRAKGQNTITASRNEILYAWNQADKFLLAIVLVDGEDHEGPHYVRKPFASEPDGDAVSVNYKLDALLAKAVPPEASLASGEDRKTADLLS